MHFDHDGETRATDVFSARPVGFAELFLGSTYNRLRHSSSGSFPQHYCCLQRSPHRIPTYITRTQQPTHPRHPTFSPHRSMPATVNSTSWRMRYPRRSPHPPRTRIRLDAVERAAATGSNVLCSFGLPVSLDEKRRPSTPRQCPQQAERNTDSSTSITYGGPEDTGSTDISSSRGDDAISRAVRFDSVVKIILVPTRSDLGGLSEDLWWREEDYLQFR